MKKVKFHNLDCISLENASLSLLVTRSVGPRVVSLCLKGGENLFAELPDFVTDLPDGTKYHFYGGHRLWHAPETMPRTYVPDDDPVDIVDTGSGLSVTQPVEPLTGIEKSLQVSLVGETPQVVVCHTLTNRGHWPVECAPWAITQLKPGGVAILPQSQQQTGFLPNRTLAFWSYSDLADPRFHLGSQYLRINSDRSSKPFKVGFANLRGWLAYWNAGTLFVKRAPFDPRLAYYDFNSSSECYCNDRFLELETLAPIRTLEPGEACTHTETWEIHAGVEFPGDEVATRAMVEKLGLE